MQSQPIKYVENISETVIVLFSETVIVLFSESHFAVLKNSNFAVLRNSHFAVLRKSFYPQNNVLILVLNICHHCPTWHT